MPHTYLMAWQNWILGWTITLNAHLYFYSYLLTGHMLFLSGYNAMARISHYRLFIALHIALWQLSLNTFARCMSMHISPVCLKFFTHRLLLVLPCTGHNALPGKLALMRSGLMWRHHILNIINKRLTDRRHHLMQKKNSTNQYNIVPSHPNIMFVLY